MRRGDRYGKVSLLLSVAVHGAAIALTWASTLHRQPPIEFLAYEIELVSPPPAAEVAEPAPPQEELVVERPEPEPPPEPEPVEEEVTVAPEPEPEPEPEPPPPEPEPAPPEPEPEPPEPEPQVDDEPQPSGTLEPPPDAEPSDVSGSGINVRLEGLRRDYPQYYENIINQIFRCFRWRRGGNWEATVFFNIHRDGTVTDLDWVRRSGNTSFDLEALGAVECAGQGRFGPLPADFPYDVLPVTFQFTGDGGG
ncbi:MAG TPA: TonB C-terminal domain-containing protein [Longimicrobiales bacterium]|nr:TonB C-terminal domain-containing protein [Longimicrobiales bacterium]